MKDPEDQISFILFWMVVGTFALMLSMAFIWASVSMGADIFRILEQFR